MTERRRSEVNPRTLGFRLPRDNAPTADFEQGYRSAMEDLQKKLEAELNTWTRDGGFRSGVRSGLMIALEFIEGGSLVTSGGMLDES